MQQEYWKPVVGWEDFYEVSDQGRVRSVPRTIELLCNGTLGKRSFPSVIRKLHLSRRGYWTVRLHAQGRKGKTFDVHHLVAEAFIGPRPPRYDTCHGAKGRQCNEPSNLSYGTRSENLKDRDRDGTHQRGEQGPGSKLTFEHVRAIKRSKGKETSAEVAKRYGVSFSTVCMIWRGLTWIDA